MLASCSLNRRTSDLSILDQRWLYWNVLCNLWSRIFSPIGLDLYFLFALVRESLRIMIVRLNIKILSILFMHVLLC